MPDLTDHLLRRNKGSALLGPAGVLGALVVAAFSAPRAAHANALQRFAVHGEGGLGTMLPAYQRDTLGYGLVTQGALRIGFSFVDPLALQLSFGSTIAPGQNGTGQQYTVAGGLRFEPRVGRAGRFFIDANAGLGQTASLSRFGLDGGLGFEFALLPFLALGPYARYHHLFATDADFPSDAQYWTAGLSVTLRAPPPREPLVVPRPVDTDADTVLDADDICPTVPQGERPDPARRGCPLEDSDRDGVSDRDDVCPTVPQGEHPDPARRGCPLEDTDRDGVFDNIDQCPDTAQGEHPDPRRPGCPDGDDDNDRVRNAEDQCPQQHHGLHPDPARPGCPQPDRDNDSVPDPTDACPDQPGAPSTDPQRNGCPGLVRIEGDQIRINRPVFFATNRDVILPRSQPVLRAVADALRANPGIRRVRVEGHTDDVADDAFNLDLSRRRANNVMAALIQAGVEPERIEAQGYGETRPLVQGTTPAARAANRRVEFHIIDPPPAGATATNAALPGASAPAPANAPSSAAPPARTPETNRVVPAPHGRAPREGQGGRR